MLILVGARPTLHYCRVGWRNNNFTLGEDFGFRRIYLSILFPGHASERKLKLAVAQRRQSTVTRLFFLKLVSFESRGLMQKSMMRSNFGDNI